MSKILGFWVLHEGASGASGFSSLNRTRAITRIALSIFFVGTGFLKSISFSSFVSSIKDFDILPNSTVLPFAVVVVMIEASGGIGLLIGSRVRLFSLALTGLVALCTTAILIELLQGNEAECGCFGEYIPLRIDWWSVARNIVLCLLLLWSNPKRRGEALQRGHNGKGSDQH